MNGKQHPAGAAPRAAIEEIFIQANGVGPGGSPVVYALVLMSPTRFYLDLKVPELVQDQLIISNDQATGQARRSAIHNLLDQWLRVQRQVVAAGPVAAMARGVAPAVPAPAVAAANETKPNGEEPHRQVPEVVTPPGDKPA